MLSILGLAFITMLFHKIWSKPTQFQTFCYNIANFGLGIILVKTVFAIQQSFKIFDFPKVGHDLPKMDLKGHLDLNISSHSFDPCISIMPFVRDFVDCVD